MIRAWLLVALVGVARLFGASAELASAPSAYLRAQAASAVNWRTWGEPAFAEARQPGKPVFVFIGAPMSELSRAMLRQSFGHEETTAFLNEHFVCVLVDTRTEPALTAFFQAYVDVAKQQSGLPMNLWLTPALKPIDGATYLPPSEEWGKEGFLTVARRIAGAWKADPTAQEARAEESVGLVVGASAGASRPKRQPEAMAASVSRGIATRAALLKQGPDAHVPGEPNALEPELLSALLRDPSTREIAVARLRSAIGSALRDPLDGGVYRSTTDGTGRVPYFQKHLTDQARAALVLLEAAKLTGEPGFAAAARGVLGFVLDELALDGGGFAGALDATPEALTSTQLWTQAEIEGTTGPDAVQLCRLFGVRKEGNLPADALGSTDVTGKNVLARASSDAAEASAGKLAVAIGRLRERRRQKGELPRAEAATSGEHGLLLGAFARAGAQLSDERFAAAAKATERFLRERLLSPTGELKHWPESSAPALATDYAQVVWGLRTTSAASGDPKVNALAAALQAKLNTGFFDRENGRYFAARRHEQTGIWADVHAPLHRIEDPPSTEAVMLSMFAESAWDAELAPALAAFVSGELDNAMDRPRGDYLMALQSYLSSEARPK